MRAYNISSVVQKVLHFQAGITHHFGYSYFRPMSSVSSMDPNVDRVLSYYVDGDNILTDKWFRGGPKVDAEIKDQFGGLVEDARASKLKSWTAQPTGTLALLILLDQFPRSMFRGSGLSFSSDAMALTVATEAIARGFDRQVPLAQQSFFYLPLMHNESLLGQVAGLALYEALAARYLPGSPLDGHLKEVLKFAQRHLDCILRFGRYPGRNDALGRKSTAEEMEFLKEHPMGF